MEVARVTWRTRRVRDLFYDCVIVNSTETYMKGYVHSRTKYGIKVDDKHCGNLPKPVKYEPCQGPCDSIRWHYGPWSEVGRLKC